MTREGPDNNPREKARRKAWRLLQIRPHSEWELRKKLRDRGFQPDVLDEVFEELKRYRYLDDAAYAFQTARHLAVDRLLGNRRIVFYLREKGLDDELITQAISEARQAFSEEDALKKSIHIKMRKGPLAGLEDKGLQKVIRSLWGKGFSTALILEIVKRMKNEEERNS